MRLFESFQEVFANAKVIYSKYLRFGLTVDDSGNVEKIEIVAVKCF